VHQGVEGSGHGVDAVAAHHMGAGMMHMLEKMGLTLRLGERGSAKEAAARVALRIGSA
jgi:predicted Fe-Mo cluster-binding NifX family protein